MIPDSTTSNPGSLIPGSLFLRIGAWFRHVRADLDRESSVPGIRWVSEFILPILIGAVLTIGIRLIGFDLKLQQLIFESGENSWAIGKRTAWDLLYRHGSLPAAIVAIIGGIGVCLSFFRKELRPWRRIFAFTYLTMVVGSGVIVNAGLKDNWGRPRPKEVVNFGGEYHFEPVLSIDSSSPGNSFPSGHAAMGFYFLGGFFLFRRHRRGLARGFLIGGIAFGTLMGTARLLQGGHFLSDILWAGLIWYYTAMGLYFALGLNRNLFELERTKSWQIPRRATLWGVPLLLILLAGILLTTPYRSRWEAPVGNLPIEDGIFDLQLILTVGEVEVLPSDSFGITMEASGFGVPTSRIKRNFLANDKREVPEVVYKEELRGWFSDLSSKVTIRVPWDRVRRIKLNAADAEVRVLLGDEPADTLIEVVGGNRTIQVSTAGQRLKVSNPEGRASIERTNHAPLMEGEEDGAGYRMTVGGWFKGAIKIDED
ncbi:MAG: phosphatase PAP2 family protein [Verrucomicrobiales bacterium]